MQRDGCNYCRIGLKRLTKGSPRNNYRYCPMCGKYLEESGKGGATMKISEVNSNYIKFDNGSLITYEHERDCCEWNYADFEQIEKEALQTVFDEDIIFEIVEGSGFRFGSKGTHMFFIPCYSDQNGYYSSDIDIYFNNKPVASLGCELIIY